MRGPWSVPILADVELARMHLHSAAMAHGAVVVRVRGILVDALLDHMAEMA